MPEEKRDYYEVLGVQKGATEDEIKKHTGKRLKNTTPICTRTIKKQKKNSRNATKHTKCFRTRIKSKIRPIRLCRS